jgi:lysophospholipase
VEAAPLLDLPEAPAPAGAQPQWFTGAGGVRLRAALFPATAPGRGSVVLSPGRTEPLEKYFEVIGELQGRGFTVLVHDWRGQGLSDRLLADRLKSHARGWRPFLADFKVLLDLYERRLPRPWIALGHSMGGGLTVLALSEGEARFAGAVLSSPMLGLRLKGRPESLVRVAAWFMTLIGRGGDYVFSPQDRRDDAEHGWKVLTHDRARWRRYQAQLAAAPDLMVDGFTWGWLAFALRLTFRIEKMPGAERIGIPITFVAAQHDHLCTNRAQRGVVTRARRGRFVVIPGAFHEVLMEQDERRDRFWEAFDALADEVAPAS